MLTKRAVDEFREIYERQYGVVLSNADATVLATELLNLYRAVYPSPNMKKDTSNDKPS